MQHFGPFAVGIACFVFLAVAAVARIVADYKKRQLAAIAATAITLWTALQSL